MEGGSGAGKIRIPRVYVGDFQCINKYYLKKKRKAWCHINKSQSQQLRAYWVPHLEPARRWWDRIQYIRSERVPTTCFSRGVRKANIRMLTIWWCLRHYRDVKELSSYQLRGERKLTSIVSHSLLVIIFFFLDQCQPPRPLPPPPPPDRSPESVSVHRSFSETEESSSMVDWLLLLCFFTLALHSSHLARASLSTPATRWPPSQTPSSTFKNTQLRI